MTPIELRARRRALGLTQVELGAVLGVAANTIARWERGEFALGSPQLVRLAIERLELAHPGNRSTPTLLPRPSGAGQSHNLPVQLTSFVGRETEAAELQHLIGTNRLLTLVGTGGCGKTRLALHVAGRMRAEFPDGIWFVELAPIRDGGLIAWAVAGALDLTERPRRPLVETIAIHLAGKRCLLLVDNCEHLVDGCAELAETLLRACPSLTILATSRQALNAPGESLWRVPSLSLPDQVRPAAAADWSASDAVRLFVERARLGRPDFALDENAETVAQICRRLDGIPLALELAAVRLRAMPVWEVLARLEDRFQLLDAGAPRTVPRQQTLRGTIDWSHDLLTTAEQILFRRISVFRGGFDLPAAESVCGGDGLEPQDVLGLVIRLVDRSLVLAEESRQGQARYRFLETMSQYATERLRESGEEETVSERHAGYVLALVETDSAFGGPRQSAWLELIAGDHDNTRAALDWLIRHDPGRALRLAGALGWFWFLRGLAGEGRSRLEAALDAAPQPTAARARALNWAGSLARHQGDYAVALDHLNEALALARQLGDVPLVAEVLHRRGTCLYERGDYAAAQTDLETSLALCRELGDRHAAAGVLGLLGVLAHHRGDLGLARARTEESLPMHRASSDVYATSQSLAVLGRIALQQADYGLARASLLDAISLARRLGNTFGLFLALEGWAGLDAVRGRPERALRLAAAVSVARDATGTMLAQHWQATTARWLEIAWTRLSAPAAEAAWEAGRRLTLEQAIDETLEDAPPALPTRRAGTALTQRQWEIAALVAEGLTNRQIADRLIVSERTVDGHLERIRNRLGVRARAQIAAWVVEAGRIAPPVMSETGS